MQLTEDIVNAPLIKTVVVVLGGKRRVHPSAQWAGRCGEEEISSGAGEWGAEGETTGSGGGQAGPASGDGEGQRGER